jgi:hypothetical protein
MASSKRMENTVQFTPVGWSLGTEEGKMLVVVRVVDMVDHDVFSRISGSVGKLRAHNL